MTQNYYKKYFDLNIFVLKACGLWIPETTEPRKQKIRQLIWNIISGIYLHILYFPAGFVILFTQKNWTDLIRYTRDNVNFLALVFKICVWYVNRKAIMNILNVLRGEKFSYEGSENFNPDEITKKHMFRGNTLIQVFMVFLNSTVLIMACSVTYIFMFHSESQYVVLMDRGNETQIYDQKLPAEIWLPVDQKTKRWFLFSFVFQSVAYIGIDWNILAVDTLFLSLMGCICCHLDIIKEALKTLGPRCKEKLMESKPSHNKEEYDERMENELKDCVRHLQVLLTFSKTLEDIYNKQALVQCMVSVFQICFCFFSLYISTNENLSSEFFYLLNVLFELFIYCWFGNEVTDMGYHIPYALFEGDWITASAAFKQDMQITMTRMRKPIFLTIGKFSPLSLLTFLSIGRTAYSFFTVLQTRGDRFTHLKKA